MKGDLRCVDGRLMRHDPQQDDPDLETDIGECPDCSGAGCAENGDAADKPELDEESLRDPDREREERRDGDKAGTRIMEGA
jgi:hypothetical protein